MKITLISPYYSVTAYGLRVLSSALRRRGHDARLIFLPYMRPNTPEDFLAPYPASVLAQVGDACADSDIVGISLMSNYLDRAAALTGAVRAAGRARIVWGGIHATVSPEECLDHADFLCIGEGEEATAELLDRLAAGDPNPAVAGIWSKVDGQVRRMAPCALIQDLNALPFPDYDTERHKVLFGEDLVAFTPELLRFYHSETMAIAHDTAHLTGIRGRLPVVYQTMASRGCPFSCTYCCNDALKRQNRGQRILRFRGPKNIVDEIVSVQERFRFFDIVLFSDDSLLTMPDKDFFEFCRQYKERVGKPMLCLATPTHTEAAKAEALVDAGMVKIKIGIQSGSARILDLYQRKVTNEQILKAARVMAGHLDRCVVDYDVILDSPWETTADKLDTLDLTLKLPRPFNLVMYSLTLYPGTQLYDQARREGVGQRNMYDSASFYIRRPTYINMLFYMVNRQWPVWLIRFFENRLFVFLFNRRPFELTFGLIVRTKRKSRRFLKWAASKLRGRRQAHPCPHEPSEAART